MIQRMNRLETPIICEIVAEYESPADAMAHEKRLIASYGRVSTNDGTLYNVYPGTDAGNVGRNAKITEHALRFSNLQLVRRCAPLNKDQDMTDPKIARLATAIAEALSALVALAQDGESILHTVVPGADAVAVMKQGNAEMEEILTAEEPKRRGRPPKADAALAAESSSAEEAATPASEHTTATEAGTQATGAATTTETATTSSEAESPETLEDARKLAVDLAKAKGRAGLLDVLTQFGAAGVSALEPDQIADFCDAVRESLAA